jgi:hypothetical protein
VVSAELVEKRQAWLAAGLATGFCISITRSGILSFGMWRVRSNCIKRDCAGKGAGIVNGFRRVFQRRRAKLRRTFVRWLEVTERAAALPSRCARSLSLCDFHRATTNDLELQKLPDRRRISRKTKPNA